MEETTREYQRAIRYLCGCIRDGSIAVGDRLPTERTLSETLQISRNSTREALRSMENMGIVESRRGSGSYYTGNISKKLSEMIRTLLLIRLVSQEEICAFRRTMEVSVCVSVIGRGDFDLAEAETALALPAESVEEEARQDERFHSLLAQASGNRFWIELMDALGDVYRTWIEAVLRGADAELRRRLHAAHGAILDGLRQRDAAACTAAVNAHYDLSDLALRRQAAPKE